MDYVYHTTPYAHQKEAFEKVYGKEYFALFMEQGTGKTKTLIDIASNLYLEHKINAVLVFAPNRVHTQWAKEQLPLHSAIDYDVFIWENKRTKRDLYDLNTFILPAEEGEPLKWFFVNIEAMSSSSHLKVFQDYVKNNNCMVVVDEATRIKNPTASRTVNITQGLSELTKIRDTIISCKPYAKYRAILTGMMVTNSPFDVWSMYEFLKHNYFGRTFYSFKKHYGLTRSAQTAKEAIYSRNLSPRELASIRSLAANGMAQEVIARTYGITIPDVIYIKNNPDIKVPYRNLPELKELIKDTCYIVRKADCLDLPEQIYETIKVTLTDEQIRIYNEFIDDHYSEFNDASLFIDNKITLSLRLQQITSGFFPTIDGGAIITDKNPKIEAIIDQFDEIVDFPILIFSRFKNEVRQAYETIKARRPDLVVEMITGDISGKKNQDSIDRFKRNEIDVLVNITSMVSLGQNFQEFCHTSIYLSNDYSLETRIQSEDRTHRSGQKEKTLYLDVIAEGSVDERITKVLKSKEELLDYMYSESLLDFVGGKL